MSILDTFRAKINSNATLQSKQAFDDNKKQASLLLEQKRLFLNRLDVMKKARAKKDTSRTTFENLDTFESYLMLKDGIFAGIKNVEDGRVFFEFAIPRNKTRKTYDYYFVSEIENNTPKFPNFNIFHIIEDSKRTFFAKTNIRTAVITAPMQATTEMISPNIDKTLGINLDTIHKAMPIKLINELLHGEESLITKATTERQWYQIHKLQQGL